jgi:SAM-dependent methyltransferase
VGLDYSAGMLQALARRTTAVAPVQGDANVLPIATNSVDVVIAAWMLYHVDPDRVLPECRRVLRPGGRLIASTNAPEFLPTLDDLLLDSASAIAGRRLDRWIGGLAFNSENGAAVIGRYFPDVERVVVEVPYEVPAPEPLLAYVDSIRGPVLAGLGGTFDFDAFLALVRRGIEARLASGPVRFVRRIAFFLAPA